MKYSPHNYQKYVIEFIKQHPIAAILLDMGMGKTSIVLSALNELMYDSFEVTKVLIIAPLRVARNTWSDEIKKWDHLKGLRYQQTVARLWRQGQTEGTVSVIHIVTDGTVDERILKALEAKDLTQSALIDAVKAEVGDGK